MPDSSADVLTPEEALLARARRGDRDALEELLRGHWPVAFRVARRLLGRDDDAQDAVQDAMLKLVVHWGEFDGRCGFRTWLLRIVTNAALDLGRKRGRQERFAGGSFEVDEPATEEDPLKELKRQDLRRALDDALAQLSPTIRATFVLFAEAGLSYKEVAEALGVPTGTVMSRLSYARVVLKTVPGLQDFDKS